MTDVVGDFEIHFTVWAGNAEPLAAFAEARGVKHTQIELDRGSTPTQPMLTVFGRGGSAEQQALATQWRAALGAANLSVQRVKVEAAPWSVGVPATDAEAADEPAERYFEHHIKLLLPDDGLRRLVELADLVNRHEARTSRNARRQRPDGQHERFVTQRCRPVGRPTARQRLDALLAALRAAGHEILEVEEEYVIADDDLDLDAGWFVAVASHARRRSIEDRWRTAPAGGENFPPTYRLLPSEDGISQRGAFDPALKQFRHAYRAGEPSFDDADRGQRWRAARRAALNHVLAAVAGSPLARNLVLRGSVLLRAWLGTAAREPGDLDFVVVPPTMIVGESQANRLLDGVIEAVRLSPGAGVDADGVIATDIWTYERAPGRRLVFPFAVDDLPPGTVQLDFVFNESLPVDAAVLQLPPLDTAMLAATPELSLAWKLLWLVTDSYPQGKDLYDAVLLAEYAGAPADLIRLVLRKELGAEADSFEPASLLRLDVDWTNFTDEYPMAAGLGGDAETWKRRLALALSASPEVWRGRPDSPS